MFVVNRLIAKMGNLKTTTFRTSKIIMILLTDLIIVCTFPNWCF
jgi:hypothetical protein